MGEKPADEREEEPTTSTGEGEGKKVQEEGSSGADLNEVRTVTE